MKVRRDYSDAFREGEVAKSVFEDDAGLGDLPIVGSLCELVRRIDRERADWTAIHFKFSSIIPGGFRNTCLNVALSLCEILLRGEDVRLFRAETNDLFVLMRKVSEPMRRRCVDRITQILRSEPAAAADAEFSTVYLLESDYDAFEELTRGHRNQADRMRVPAGLSKTPLEPAVLTRLEDLLGSTDVSMLIRKQPVVSFKNPKEPFALFREITVAMDELQTAVAPGIDLFADDWLFQRLTQTLDRRVLAMFIAGTEKSLRGSVSLNLNVSTVLGPRFLKFAKETKLHGQKIVVEIQVFDVFRDIRAFNFARDFLRERGCQVCLDGAAYETLPLLDPKRLGTDYIKITVGPELLREARQPEILAFEEFVDRTQQTKLILARIDNDEGMELGYRFGIELFQGRHVDKLLRVSQQIAEQVKMAAARAPQ